MGALCTGAVLGQFAAAMASLHEVPMCVPHAHEQEDRHAHATRLQAIVRGFYTRRFELHVAEHRFVLIRPLVLLQ